MAFTTFTASEVSGVRYLPAKILTKTSLFTMSTSTAAQGILFLCKVPHNAVILDFIFFVDDAGDAQTWQLGILQPEGSASTTVSPSAISPPQDIAAGGAVLRPAGINLPYRVSISDGCLQRWGWITAESSAALSTSMIMRFTVKYMVNGTEASNAA